MSRARVKDPTDDPFKSFFPNRPRRFLVLLLRIPSIVCLVGSIFFILYSAFANQSRSSHFVLPNFTAESTPEPEPTNISHILFSIGGSAATWHERSRYINLWWESNRTRGFVWLDEEPRERNVSNTMPYRVSDPGWTRFRFLSARSAVRIARIIWDSFKLNLPNVRWFIMGDDDTVFFTDNLVSVLTRYDHKQMWYIGCNSESAEQNGRHAYDMAFGGGGFAVSYPLAEKLVNALDGCLVRYYYFYGSDKRIWACISEIGVPLTTERGFHQLDIRGDPYGLLAAHPIAPLVSLHHIEYFNSLFPKRTQIDSLETLIHAYRVDPLRILQQSLCYDPNRDWSISISWGYTIQIYPLFLSANNLATPLQTFKTWRSWNDGPFSFNTRAVSTDPCDHPIVYFLDRVESVNVTGTQTVYTSSGPLLGKSCDKASYVKATEVKTIIVSSLRMDPKYWHGATQRQCCEIMDGGSITDGTMRIRVRKLGPKETMTVLK